MSTTPLRKITPGTIIGENIAAMIRGGKIPGAEKDGATIPIIELFASVAAVEVKETDLGPSLKMLGAFEATNILTGEVFDAPVAYLPGLIADRVGSAFAGEQEGAVQFAGTLTLKIDHKASTGYTYGFIPKVMKSVDALASLKAEVLALAAPIPAPVIAEAKEEKAEAPTKKK